MRPYVNPFDINNFTVIPIIGNSPAAGAPYIGTAPVNARSQLALISCQLVTDVNVADRFIELQLHRSGNVYPISHSFTKQTANTTRKYLSFVGSGVPFSTTDNSSIFSLPDVPLFLEGDTIVIAIVNIQAADQINTVRSTWKVWPYEQ